MIFFPMNKKKKIRDYVQKNPHSNLSFVGQSINQSLGDSSSSNSSSRRGTVRPIYSTCKYLRGKKTTETFRIPPIISILSLSVCLSVFLSVQKEWKPVHLLLGKGKERAITPDFCLKKTKSSHPIRLHAVLFSLEGGKKATTIKSNH